MATRWLRVNKTSCCALARNRAPAQQPSAVERDQHRDTLVKLRTPDAGVNRQGVYVQRQHRHKHKFIEPTADLAYMCEPPTETCSNHASVGSPPTRELTKP
jgi:hypothetical protein